MRNNNLIQREKRHTTAYMRVAQSNDGVVKPLTLKALHHAQMCNLAARSRREFKRRPREVS
jgi:hypothetical protein